MIKCIFLNHKIESQTYFEPTVCTLQQWLKALCSSFIVAVQTQKVNYELDSIYI